MQNLRVFAIAAACLIGLGLAQAIDLPLQKEGLWSMHSLTIDNPGGVKRESTQTICRNHAYDLSVRAKAKNVPGCKIINESLNGGVYNMEMECTVSGSVLHSKGTTTSEGENTVRAETHTTFTPPLYGVSDTTMTMEQKYLGACPAGAQPGDITHPDGSVTHTWKP